MRSLTPLPSLEEALAHFNKSEPDLMVRDAFGHQQKTLCLADDFRKRLEIEAGLGPVPETAWWAIEYPFNCLAGALAVFAQGETAIGKLWPNAVSTDGRVADKLKLDRDEARKSPGKEWKKRELPRLATSGREDVDFVVAYGNTLILLEAKGYTSYGNDQINSKLDRLELLHQYYSHLPQAAERPIDFRFILWSPGKPQKVSATWPDFAKPSNGGIPHVKLDAGPPLQFNVTRSEQGPKHEYAKWSIERKK